MPNMIPCISGSLQSSYNLRYYNEHHYNPDSFHKIIWIFKIIFSFKNIFYVFLAILRHLEVKSCIHSPVAPMCKLYSVSYTSLISCFFFLFFFFSSSTFLNYNRNNNVKTNCFKWELFLSVFCKSFHIRFSSSFPSLETFISPIRVFSIRRPYDMQMSKRSLPAKKWYSGYDTKLYQMVRFHFWNSWEYGVPLVELIPDEHWIYVSYLCKYRHIDDKILR